MVLISLYPYVAPDTSAATVTELIATGKAAMTEEQSENPHNVSEK